MPAVSLTSHPVGQLAQDPAGVGTEVADDIAGWPLLSEASGQRISAVPTPSLSVPRIEDFVPLAWGPVIL